MRASLAAVIFALACGSAAAQGCAQCRDSVQGTPNGTQTAYRHAIEILGGAGVAVFVGGVLLMRGHRSPFDRG